MSKQKNIDNKIWEEDAAEFIVKEFTTIKRKQKVFPPPSTKRNCEESSRWIKSLENSIHVSKYKCICKRHWPPDYKKISVAIWQIATRSSKHISRIKTEFNSSQTRQTTSYKQKLLRVRNRKDNELKAFQIQDKVSFETLVKRGSYS